MKDYTTDAPAFSDHIKVIETTDLVHADNANAAPIQLLQNTMYNHKAIKAVAEPELDIPEDGEVEGISSFPDFLATMVSKIPLVQILRNAYAGFQFVLHVGHIVNNCASESTDLPLAAKQGKVLMDLYTKLNSEKIRQLNFNQYNSLGQCIQNILNANTTVGVVHGNKLLPEFSKAQFGTGGYVIGIVATIPDGHYVLIGLENSGNALIAYGSTGKDTFSSYKKI